MKGEDYRKGCDWVGCEKKATRNYQKLWVMWKHKKDGGYSKTYKYKGCDIEEPVGEDNMHFCDEDGHKFERGEDGN